MKMECIFILTDFSHVVLGMLVCLWKINDPKLFSNIKYAGSRYMFSETDSSGKQTWFWNHLMLPSDFCSELLFLVPG